MSNHKIEPNLSVSKLIIYSSLNNDLYQASTLGCVNRVFKVQVDSYLSQLIQKHEPLFKRDVIDFIENYKKAFVLYFYALSNFGETYCRSFVKKFETVLRDFLFLCKDSQFAFESSMESHSFSLKYTIPSSAKNNSLENSSVILGYPSQTRSIFYSYKSYFCFSPANLLSSIISLLKMALNWTSSIFQPTKSLITPVSINDSFSSFNIPKFNIENPDLASIYIFSKFLRLYLEEGNLIQIFQSTSIEQTKIADNIIDFLEKYKTKKPISFVISKLFNLLCSNLDHNFFEILQGIKSLISRSMISVGFENLQCINQLIQKVVFEFKNKEDSIKKEIFLTIYEICEKRLISMTDLETINYFWDNHLKSIKENSPISKGELELFKIMLDSLNEQFEACNIIDSFRENNSISNLISEDNWKSYLTDLKIKDFQSVVFICLSLMVDILQSESIIEGGVKEGLISVINKHKLISILYEKWLEGTLSIKTKAIYCFYLLIRKRFYSVPSDGVCAYTEKLLKLYKNNWYADECNLDFKVTLVCVLAISLRKGYMDLNAENFEAEKTFQEILSLYNSKFNTNNLFLYVFSIIFMKFAELELIDIDYCYKNLSDSEVHQL